MYSPDLSCDVHTNKVIGIRAHLRHTLQCILAYDSTRRLDADSSAARHIVGTLYTMLINGVICIISEGVCLLQIHH